jgi:hypothetical protein
MRAERAKKGRQKKKSPEKILLPGNGTIQSLQVPVKGQSGEW